MKALRTIVALVVCTCTWTAAMGLPTRASAAEGAGDPAARLLRDASLMLLKEGNARYLAGKPQYPHQDAERRSSTSAQGQEPFATILACSDSREPVELIFDRGIGDLFVVRVAGNIAGTSELATVEYGVAHLHTPLLVVMGHSKCGAVTAVVKGAELHGHLEALGNKIKPAVAKVKTEGLDGDEAVTRAIQANVWQTMEDIIQMSSVVREKISSGRLHVLGAVYDLELGRVTWLGPHPGQDGFIALAKQALTDPALVSKLSAPPASAKDLAPAKPLTSGPAVTATSPRAASPTGPGALRETKRPRPDHVQIDPSEAPIGIKTGNDTKPH